MIDSLSHWLELREPYDHASRSEALTRAVVDSLPRDRTIRVVDLGTGTGSNVRYVAPRFAAPQDWLLVDADPAVLAAAPARLAGVDRGVSFETRQQNLTALDADIIAGRDLITASALLNLVSESWLERLALACRAAGAVALFALTYTGRSSCTPTEPEDDLVCELLNRHQRTNDKGFGPAAGPGAVDVAERCFAAAGYRVQRVPSDWDLDTSACELQRQLVQVWANAAFEMAADRKSTIRDWLARRVAHIDAGRSRIVVCHEDLTAL